MKYRQLFEIMPKAELHLHLDGAFTLDHLFELTKKYKSELKINSIDDLKKRFIYKDFSHFVDLWFWKNSLFREPIDFEISAYETLKELSTQNIVYVEAFFSPWDYGSSLVRPSDIANAYLKGIAKAESELSIQCKLIADLTRDHGHETALTRLDEITPFLGDKIIGIGLGGSEHKFPAYLFKDVFVEAVRRGFHCVAHAGEVAGPESIWSAINDLNVERIGHGVRSIEDSKLIEYLSKEQIPLEVCIKSNIKTGVYKDIGEHPFLKLLSNGLLLTVNSDDPTMFNSTLADEYYILHNEMGISLSNIIKIQNNAVECSFASIKVKNSIKKRMNSFWIDNNIS